MRFRRHHVRAIFAAAALAVMPLAAVVVDHAFAVEDDPGASYLSPFPDGDIYQVTVIGDTFADGILFGLVESMGTDVRLNIQRKLRPVYAIMSGDFETKAKAFEASIATEPMNIAIVMMGEDDRVTFRNADGRRVYVATPDWVAEYSRRIDRLMKAIKRKNASVYWVGLPNLARAEANEQATVMNETIRERAYLNGFKYIDAAAGFTDENGAYSTYGPDLAGKIRVLRERDGVHFTEAGNRKLAHFVEKDLRRDLNQAKSNRNVPLLGAEAEQAKINPDNANKAPAPLSPVAANAQGATAATSTTRASKADGSITRSSSDATGDQKADNGKVTLKVIGSNGREEQTTVEIVRPAIPATVIQLMARRDSAGQAGDLLVDQIAGGLTLMSSIAPSSNQAKGRLAPTQAPYFRLLVKGERLTPKPGRADDVSWPANGDRSSQRVAPSGPATTSPPG